MRTRVFRMMHLASQRQQRRQRCFSCTHARPTTRRQQAAAKSAHAGALRALFASMESDSVEAVVVVPRGARRAAAAGAGSPGSREEEEEE